MGRQTTEILESLKKLEKHMKNYETTMKHQEQNRKTYKNRRTYKQLEKA